MQHQHIFSCQLHFFLGKNVKILQSDVILLIEETLSLYPGHIEHVQLTHGIFQALHLFKCNVVGSEHIVPDVGGNPKFLRGNQDKFHILIADQRIDQGMNGSAKFQIPAKTNGQVSQTSL